MSTTIATRTLEVPGAVLTYDVRTPADPSDRPPLFVLGSPMGASGFAQLVAQLEDRTVLTYDPRMAERSRLTEGGEVSVALHAEDLHAVVADSGLGPVDVLASSGGATVSLPWAVAHPEDLRTLVAHEPPLTLLLEDGEIAQQAMDEIAATYQRDGFGPAMARFIQLIMTPNPLPADFLQGPAPDPAQFGFPAEDDGRRDDPLLAHNLPMAPYRPDAAELEASGVRIVPAIGERGEGTLARRGGEALAQLLGVEPVVFPGDHGGFAANDWTPDNDPAAFAARLREVLDGPAGVRAR